MTLLLGYETALQFWRFSGQTCSERFSARRNATNKAARYLASISGTKDDRTAIHKDIENVPVWIESPVHILTTADARVRTKGVKSHCVTAIPKASFIEYRKDILISSPEYCLIQMATQLDVIRLVKLAYELCGKYSLCPEEKDGFINDGIPMVTSKQRISDYLALNPGFHGNKTLARACKYVQDRSASPMETAVSMLLTMPRSLGGYGLPAAQLNYEVRIPENTLDKRHKSYCECDLIWPAARLCVEYDSKLHHTGEDKIADDSERRNILQNMGIDVITITNKQAYSKSRMDLAASHIGKRLGKRARESDFEFTRRMANLRNITLDLENLYGWNIR